MEQKLEGKYENFMDYSPQENLQHGIHIMALKVTRDQILISHASPSCKNLFEVNGLD